MISLYIHIPFCASKCAYCSFNSLPIFELENSESLITNYVEALKKEIDHYSETLTDKSLKTLYFWWWTPSRIWVERIIDIIEYIKAKFDMEDLAELSIELNPYPEDEVLKFVQTLNRKYQKISRLRYSFGIQSFDDEILKITWRAYTFGSVVQFLRRLVGLKQENNVFNFDFIAFGKFQISKNGHKQLWHEFKREFLNNFLTSWCADSISLYTLENIKDKPCPKIYFGTDDEIMEEFLILKDMVEHAGFMRYEISNFASAGKASIHNMVYWNMEPYIGLWLSASSFLSMKHVECWMQKLFPNSLVLEGGKFWTLNSEFWIRWTNTWDIKQYIEGNRIDEKEVQVLNASDMLIEEFFLRLRTREGIANLSKFIPMLVSNYESLLQTYQKERLLSFDWIRLQLTDEGMNVYNSIITDLLKNI